MNILILMGSPRLGGNTAELCKPLMGELGQALLQWHTFSDPATLRRELYDSFFLDRDPQGRVYCLTEPQPDPQALGI